MSAPPTVKRTKSVSGVTLVKGAVGAKKAAAMPDNLNDLAPASAGAVTGKKRKTPPSAPSTPDRTPGKVGQSLTSSSSSTPEAIPAKRVRVAKTVGTFVPVCPTDFKAATRMLGVDITLGQGAKLIVKKIVKKDESYYFLWDQDENIRYITFGNPAKRQPVPIYYTGMKLLKGKPSEKWACKPQISEADYTNLQAWRRVWYKILWVTGQEDSDTPMAIDRNWKKHISEEETPEKWVDQVFSKYKSWRKKALKSGDPEEKAVAEASPEEFPTDFDEVVKMQNHPSMKHAKGNWLWTDRVKISGSNVPHLMIDFDLKTTGDYPKPQHLLQVQRGGPPKNLPIREMLSHMEFGKLRVQQKFGLYDGGAVANFGVIYNRWGKPTTYLTPAKGTKYVSTADMTPAQKKRHEAERDEKSKQEMMAEFAAVADNYDSDEDTGASGGYGTSYD